MQDGTKNNPGGKRTKPLSGNASLQLQQTLKGFSCGAGKFLGFNCALKVVGLHMLHLEYKTCG